MSMYMTNAAMCGFSNALRTVMMNCVSRGGKQPVRIITKDLRAAGNIADILHAAGLVDNVSHETTITDPITGEKQVAVDIRGLNGQWPAPDCMTTVWLWAADFRKGSTSKRSAFSPR